MVGDCIIEIKVYERGQKELEVQYILTDSNKAPEVEKQTLELLGKKMSKSMDYQVKFVDFIDHDYRRKYRVIERIGDIEFAGGMVGDGADAKEKAIEEVVAKSN